MKSKETEAEELLEKNLSPVKAKNSWKLLKLLAKLSKVVHEAIIYLDIFSNDNQIHGWRIYGLNTLIGTNTRINKSSSKILNWNV